MLRILLQALAKPYFYGGQAVIEGVMMRGAANMAVAVRKTDGSITVHEERLRGLYSGPLRNVPLLRGAIVLAETLTLGMRALIFSTNAQLEDEEDGEPLGPTAVATTLGLSLLFIAGIFFIAPLVASGLIERAIDSDGFVTIAIEGIIRLVMFLGYVWAIGFLPDIRRTFGYHGAEHKAIHAYEASAPLTIDEVRRYPNAHPRCGTGFLLVVMVVAIAVFAAVGDLPWWGLIISRIALIPVIAAIAYEIVRFSAAYWRFRAVRAIFTPSLSLQALTTRDPDDEMLEVAVAALGAVLSADGAIRADSGRWVFSPAAS